MLPGAYCNQSILEAPLKKKASCPVFFLRGASYYCGALFRTDERMAMSAQFEYTSPVNPDAPEDSLEHRAPYIDHGTDRVDSERYYSRDVMDQEWERLWTRVWLIAGPRSDLREPGDYFTFDIGRESIIITLNDDENVRAFYNVCPHRGNRVVLNEHGCATKFTCTFHSWCFDLDGKVETITDEETFRPGVIKERPGLTSVKVEVKAGLIFVNLDENAPPLAERLGLPDGYLEGYQLDKMVTVRHVVSEWGANWKTGVDAFYEVYHLHAVHPQTATVMDDFGTQIDVYPHGCSRMIVPLAKKSPRVDDQTSVDPGLEYMLAEAGLDPAEFDGDASTVRNAIQDFKRTRAERLNLGYDGLVDGQLTDSWATGVFPNVQIGLHPEGAFLMKFMPHPTDPERFFYDTITLYRPVDDPSFKTPDWMGLPEGTDVSGEVRPEREFVPFGEKPDLGLVLDQDSELLPVVQKGIRSRAFKGPLWSEQETRLRHFHAELDLYLSGKK
jgi:phenylpropionate dioxygenase-like ring-hydroxylating dioxygenase large terminal subunit